MNRRLSMMGGGDLALGKSMRKRKEGNLVVILNTPKCGTGSLTATFEKSFECTREHREKEDEEYVGIYSCPDNNIVLRTHNVQEGKKTIKDMRQQHPPKKCLVVSAVRDPQTWIPSLFMQKFEKELCNADADDNLLVDKYREWYQSPEGRELISSVSQWVIPELLQEFGGVSLSEVFKSMDFYGGYSVLLHPSTYGIGDAFYNCELLMLRMEDHQIWPDIMTSILPGVSYYQIPSRPKLCPKIATQYDDLKKHVIPHEEKMAIIDSDPGVEEYFRVYGRLEESEG